MKLEVVQLLLTGLALAGGLATAVVAVASYRQRTAQEKAQWVDSICQRFSTDIVGPVRRAVGRVGDPEMDRAVKLRLAGKLKELSEDDFKRLEDFDRYFVFFEFLQYLLRKGVLKEDDLNIPFRYYLAQLEANSSTRGWLHQYYPDLRELVGKAQKWTVGSELDGLQQGGIDADLLGSRLEERLGSHPAAAKLIERAIFKIKSR